MEDRVPEEMKVVYLILAWESEAVTTSITSWELMINSRDAVEWLMDISQIMDQETKSKGLANIFIIAIVAHDSFIDEGILVSTLAR